MTDMSFQPESAISHPLDVIEHVVSTNNWVFDRSGDKEMAVQVPGRWCDYNLHFAYNEGAGAMHFSCAFDLRVSPEKRHDVYELLALINERLWLGSFGLWNNEGLPLFRHALLLRGGFGPSVEQMEDLMDTAIEECERFYPAFQYVVWAGKTAADAMTAAMIDTVGEA